MNKMNTDDRRLEIVIKVEMILEVRAKAAKDTQRPIAKRLLNLVRQAIRTFRAELVKYSLTEVIQWARDLVEGWRDWF